MADEDSGFFSHQRVAILGLGLMGGSLALALRGQCAQLLGIDPDPAALELARQRQVVDLASANAAELLPQADIIILAAPVRAILRLLGDLPALHPGPALVLDLGSTKQKVLSAMDLLPERFDPVGGHPMCGKERGGLAQADERLFRGATFAFTPLARTRLLARNFASWLAGAVGARPLWLDAGTHDRWVAATSHLPYLVANALAASTPLAAGPLVGSGFRSATRLAPTPPNIMMDILMTNPENILEALHGFCQNINQIETLLAAGDYAALQEVLAHGAEQQLSLVAISEKGDLL